MITCEVDPKVSRSCHRPRARFPIAQQSRRAALGGVLTVGRGGEKTPDPERMRHGRVSDERRPS
ncbi:predicted protein [Streptomyces sp. SPB78]|nr:predicted protein [Streptomyces sp. SPB78]